jgi:hypothetical protein
MSDTVGAVVAIGSLVLSAAGVWLTVFYGRKTSDLLLRWGKRAGFAGRDSPPEISRQ